MLLLSNAIKNMIVEIFIEFEHMLQFKPLDGVWEGCNKFEENNESFMDFSYFCTFIRKRTTLNFANHH